MAIYGYTKNYKLIKPQFNTDTWHDYIYDNLDTIDAVMSAIYASGNWKGFWATNTIYTVGDVIIDQSNDTMYKVMVDHTTSEATFAEEFAAHPTYYELWSPNNLAESWAIKMDGMVSNTDYSSKAYAISSGLIDAGSAKEWAIGSGEVGDTGEYSAKKYATDAHNDYISMTTDVNVIAVGTNIANVNAVGQSISSVNTVASDISSVNTVAGISTDVTTVASIANAVSNVSSIESEVLDVSDNRTDISTVASNIGDVNTVADISTDVSTVADNDANVTTVATNISDVNTAATNMAAIQAAPTAASNAAASATLAQDWAAKMDGQVASTDYSSKYYAGQSATSADNSHVWAEGTDAQVQALGGTHSAKVWAEQSTNANIALTNSPYTTNRILKIPQDIKLELNNGTLTLKAGSIVTELDGNYTRTAITIDTTVTSTANGTRFVFYDATYNSMWLPTLDTVTSGDTLPSAVSGQYLYHFKTDDKRLYQNAGTTTWQFIPRGTFPIAVVTVSGGAITSIDQVFNGFGYIGSTTFALPGKYAFADGKEDDGTYKTIIWENTNVLTFQTTTSDYLFRILLDYDNQNLICPAEGTFGTGKRRVWDADNNIWTLDGVKHHYLEVGSFIADTTSPYNIISLKTASVDSVANSNASNFSQAGRSYLSGLGNPSAQYIDLTLLASGSTYTAPADGYFNLYMTSTAGVLTWIKMTNNTRGGISDTSASYLPSANSVAALSFKVSKGDVVKIDYSAQNTYYFRFYKSQGEV